MARWHSALEFLKQANHRMRSRSQSREVGRTACQIAAPGPFPSLLASTPMTSNLPLDRDSVGDALGGGSNEKVPFELVPMALKSSLGKCKS